MGVLLWRVETKFVPLVKRDIQREREKKITVVFVIKLRIEDGRRSCNLDLSSFKFMPVLLEHCHPKLPLFICEL